MGVSQSGHVTAEASHRLALNLLRLLAEKEPGNIFISPLSLFSALSMLYCGAGSATAVEIGKVLGLEDIPKKDLEASFDHLLSSLEKVAAASAYSLECANSVVIQNGFPVKDNYKKVLEKSFRAMVIQEDFATDQQAAVDRINKWVDNKTHGMISRLLDSLDSLTVLVLLNAIYFKGTWKKQFSEKSTVPQQFYNKGIQTNAKEVDMMHLKDKFDFVEMETYKALQLPYKGDDIAMLILLPSALDGLEDMEKNLSPDFVGNLQREMRNRKVKISFPKFRVEYSKSLKEAFGELGMRKAFEPEADLSDICDSADLCVSDIVHKAVIEVNEEGTVAAAATAVTIQCRKLIVEPEFTVDHPFLFIIYDTKNNLNIFTGRIVEL